MELEEFFEHHGVKGMHWGIRNKRSRVTTAHPQSSDSKKVAELRKRKPHQLSNKQLQSVNARLNMEQNFSKMNPSKVQRGHDRVKAYLAIATTATTLFGLSQSPAGKHAIAAGKKYVASEQAKRNAQRLIRTQAIARAAAKLAGNSSPAGQLSLFG